MPKQKTKQKTKGTKRILVVEDELEIRELYTILLEAAGFQVQTAEHALSAVCAMVVQKPDLILVDIRMPIVDGFSFVSEIRAHRDTRDIPIIAVTGLDSFEAREAAMKAGCNGFMTKPIQPARFAKEIKSFLSSRKTAAPQMPASNKSKSKARAGVRRI